MSDHPAKGHPIGGYITVIIIAAALGYLLKMFNGEALVGYVAGGVFLLWGAAALAIFSRRDASADHH